MKEKIIIAVFIAMSFFVTAEVKAQSNQFMIKGLGGKCLDVSGSSTRNGASIILWDCHGGPNQLWTRTASGELRGVGNKCLDVDASRNADGMKIQLWDCNGGPNQKWKIAAGNRILGWGGKCLDVKESSTSNGAAVIVYQCTGNPNQRWNWERPDPVEIIRVINRTNYQVRLIEANVSGQRATLDVNRNSQATLRSKALKMYLVQILTVGTLSQYQVSSTFKTLQIEAKTVEVGPIFNQREANQKCNQIARSQNGLWNGQWWTTVPNKVSVCQIIKKELYR